MTTLREHLEWIEANAEDQESSSRASACLMALDNPSLSKRKNWAWLTIHDPQRVKA